MILCFVHSIIQHVYHSCFRDENSMTTGGKGIEEGSLDTSKIEWTEQETDFKWKEYVSDWYSPFKI